MSLGSKDFKHQVSAHIFPFQTWLDDNLLHLHFIIKSATQRDSNVILACEAEIHNLLFKKNGHETLKLLVGEMFKCH